MPMFVLYKEYIGYQPTLGTRYILIEGRDPLDIASYITEGILQLPILPYVPDLDDLGNNARGRYVQMYHVSEHIDFRYVKYVYGEGMFIESISRSSGPRKNATFLRVPISTCNVHMVCDGNSPSCCEYVIGMMTAGATRDQIDEMCVRYDLGEGRPFIWAHTQTIRAMVKASSENKTLGEGDVQEETNPICAIPKMGEEIPLPPKPDEEKPSPPPRRRTRRVKAD